ncbi:MAG: hypothetical protein AB1486_08610 [Planctomycetota bacterium]
MDNYTIGDYWSAIYRRAWLVLCVTAIAGVVSWQASVRIEPLYEAQAVFYVPSEITAADSATSVSAARMPQISREFGKSYAAPLVNRDARATIHEQFPRKSMDALERDVDVTIGRDSHIAVNVRDRDPELAARIANAYVEYFNAFHRETSRQDVARTDKDLREQILLAEAQLQQALVQRQQFREKHDVASLGSALVELERQRTKARENRDATLVEIASRKDEIASLKDELSLESEAYGESELVVASATTDALRERIAQLEVELAGKRVEFKETHPDALAIEKQLAEARAQLASEIARIQESHTKFPGSLHEMLRRQLATASIEHRLLQARLTAYEELVAELDGEIARIPALLTEADRLDDAVADVQATRDSLRGTRRELQSNALRFRSAAVPVARAVPPVTPVFPILPLNIGVAALAGLIVGSLYALLLEYAKVSGRLRRLRQIQSSEIARALANEP